MTVTEECKRTSKLFPVSEAKQSLRGTTGMRFSCGAENEVGGVYWVRSAADVVRGSCS